MKVGFKIYFGVFPGGSASKESACNVGDLGVIPGLGRSPKEGKGYPLQYSGLENSMDCIVHGVAESRTQLSDFLTGGSIGKDSACSARDLTSVSGLGRSLKKEMAPHSSILAWGIPWTEEPGGLQSMGSQRVRHD